MPRRLLIYGALLYVVLAWAINMIVAKQAIEQMNPLAFTFVRFLIMTPLAFILVWVTGGRIHIERRDIPAFLLCGACGFGLYQYFWILGLAHTTPFATALLGATSPIFTLAIVALAGHEHVRPGRWLGVGIALFGVAIFEGAFSGNAAMRIGDLLVLASAAVFAGYNVVGSRLMARYQPLELLAIGLTIGAIMLDSRRRTGTVAHKSSGARMGRMVARPVRYALSHPPHLSGLDLGNQQTRRRKRIDRSIPHARFHRHPERPDLARRVSSLRIDRRDRLPGWYVLCLRARPFGTTGSYVGR